MVCVCVCHCTRVIMCLIMFCYAFSEAPSCPNPPSNSAQIKVEANITGKVPPSLFRIACVCVLQCVCVCGVYACACGIVHLCTVFVLI